LLSSYNCGEPRIEEAPVKSYVAFVHRHGEEVTLSFPDLPGCGAAGATIEEARMNAAHFLAGHLQTLIKAGEAIPSSSSLLEIISGPQWQAEGVDAIILAVRPIARMRE
jgi:predicted RNase H-like HicB family nuclease